MSDDRPSGPPDTGISKEQLQDWAIGTLQEWFQGYTDSSVDTGFMQYKIVAVKDTPKGFVFAVREGPFFAPDGELYEVKVKVKRLGKES